MFKLLFMISTWISPLLAKDDAVQPHWGCQKQETLEEGQFHIVISSSTKLGSWSNWLPHVGLTGSHVFVEYRVSKGTSSEGSNSGVNLPLPCGMKLFFKHLSPNKGRESAVFFDHILEHYDRYFICASANNWLIIG